MLFSTKSKPPWLAEADCRKSEVIPPLRSAALLSAVVPRNFRRVMMWSRSRRFGLCLVIMVLLLRCFANEQTQVDFGDLVPEDSGLASFELQDGCCSRYLHKPASANRS